MPMSLAASEYRAPWWLPGGHLQTIVPAELFPKAKVIYRREIWNTPDDDIIAVDWSTPEPIDPKAPIMVHIHGLEGSSNSHYARALMARCGQGGVRGVVIHYRGCGGVTNKKLRAYNAADAAELDWEFARLRELYPEAPIYAMGVSLGANNLLFWAGTRGEDAAKLVSGIVAVCAPLDLVGSSHVIRKGFSRIYDLNFISTMKKKALAKAKRFPGVLDVEKIKKIRWLWQFDDLFTAPIFGYKDYMDYWTKCSSKSHLGGIRLPTLVLNAKNDPIVGNEVLPMSQEVSKFVTLEYPAEGGHCGFPRKPNEGSLGFLPTRTFDFCFRGR